MNTNIELVGLVNITPIQDGLNAYDFRNAINSALCDEEKIGSVTYEVNNAIALIDEDIGKLDAAVTESKSWAIGGTDTRTGEDEDNSKYYSEQSSNSATASANSASASATSAANALISEQNALDSEDKAKLSETNAKTSETNAKSSEQNAATSEQNALTSEQNALTSEQNAASSEQNAASSEQNAASSEQNAATSEQNAASSEQNAASSEQNALNSEAKAKTSEMNALSSEQSAAQSVIDITNLKRDIRTVIDEGFQPGQFPSLEEFIKDDVDEEVSGKIGKALYYNQADGKFYQDPEFTIPFENPKTAATYVDPNTNTTYTYNGTEYIKIGFKVIVSQSQPYANTMTVGDMWYQVISSN